MSWGCDKCLKTIKGEDGKEGLPYPINQKWLCRKCFEKEKSKGMKKAVIDKRRQLVKDIQDIDTLIKRAVEEKNVVEGASLKEHRYALAMAFEVLDDLLPYD